ncbi:venom allergen-1-like isoform X2 [Drosophila kikkawai]|uniref:Venom allergen-1-like isoform X2 n=1 Tax=Drosophila kikkawai TaxID=30033 RepID=A0ABM4GBU5_DROKI
MILHRVLPLTMLLALASCYNYCNNKTHVCNLGGLKHFMCRLEEELPPYNETTLVDIIPDTRNLQTDMVVLLNNFRDMMASGQAITKLNKTFPSATRMRRLIWDNELAYLSRVHASTVSFKHTECRSTLRFPFVGEITAMMAAPLKKKLTIDGALRRVFRRIWKTHRDVEDPKKFIEAFTTTSNFSADDLAIIINDRVSRFGCGIAVGSKDSSSPVTAFFTF